MKSLQVKADVSCLVCCEVGGEKLLPLHVRSAWILGPKRLVDPRVVVLHVGRVRRHCVVGGVDGLGDRCGSAGGGPVDGRSAYLGCDSRNARLGFVGWLPLCVGPGLFVLRPWWPPFELFSKDNGSRIAY